MTEGLRMLHLPLDPRALLAAGREHGLAQDAWAVEPGYLVHSLLARLWGERAPKPFDLQEPEAARDREPNWPPASRPVALLAYTCTSLNGLERLAHQSGHAQVLDVIDWQLAREKPMPELGAGQRLGFRVRLCPVIRVGRHHPRFRPGAEVDPYLATVERELALAERARPEADPKQLKDEIACRLPPREEVYRAWLIARLGSAAELTQARMVAMRDARLWRKGEPGSGPARLMHGRDRTRGRHAEIGRREVVMEGTLRIQDPAALTTLLARGVGRHRAFGFGMLLLRAPRGEPGRC